MAEAEDATIILSNFPNIFKSFYMFKCPTVVQMNKIFDKFIKTLHLSLRFKNCGSSRNSLNPTEYPMDTLLIFFLNHSFLDIVEKKSKTVFFI